MHDPVVNKGGFQDFLQGLVNVHGASTDRNGHRGSVISKNILESTLAYSQNPASVPTAPINAEAMGTIGIIALNQSTLNF